MAKTAVHAPVRKRKAKLGQNFLVSPAHARRIVEALGDASQQIVIEIGPGRGVLTDLLVERAGRVIAIELDRVLASQLRLRYARRNNVEIIEGDVLTVDFARLLAPRHGQPLGGLPREEVPRKGWVVGNLPYYITSDILLRLFAAHHALERIVLMVQREVAERIAAKPGSRDYGLLSTTAQLYAQVEKLFTVPPGAFNPPPKVFSSVLRLEVGPQFETLGIPEHGFLEFLKRCFAQKRKTLLNNLKPQYEEAALRAAIKQAAARPDVRAEALSLAKLAKVYQALHAASDE